MLYYYWKDLFSWENPTLTTTFSKTLTTINKPVTFDISSPKISSHIAKPTPRTTTIMHSGEGIIFWIIYFFHLLFQGRVQQSASKQFSEQFDLNILYLKQMHNVTWLNVKQIDFLLFIFYMPEYNPEKSKIVEMKYSKWRNCQKLRRSNKTNDFQKIPLLLVFSMLPPRSIPRIWHKVIF